MWCFQAVVLPILYFNNSYMCWWIFASESLNRLFFRSSPSCTVNVSSYRTILTKVKDRKPLWLQSFGGGGGKSAEDENQGGRFSRENHDLAKGWSGSPLSSLLFDTFCLNVRCRMYTCQYVDLNDYIIDILVFISRLYAYFCEYQCL